MLRSQRLNLKRKAKRQMWLATAMVALFILNIVLLVTIEWRPMFITDPETTGELGIVMFVMVALMAPMFLGLIFNVRATWTLQVLSDERRRMYKEQLRMYVEWFMKAIQEKNYERAKEIHNDLIWGDTKTLTRGIMVGLLHMDGDKEDKELALKHMDKIPDEVYDPSKEK